MKTALFFLTTIVGLAALNMRYEPLGDTLQVPELYTDSIEFYHDQIQESSTAIDHINDELKAVFEENEQRLNELNNTIGFRWISSKD